MRSTWQPTKNSAVATVRKGYAVTVVEHNNNDTADGDSSDADRKPKDRHLGDTDYSEGYEAHDEGYRGVDGRYDDETKEERHHNEEHRGNNRGHDDGTDKERHQNEADNERHHNEADDEGYLADNEETPTKDTTTKTITLGRALPESAIHQPQPSRLLLNQRSWSQTVCGSGNFPVTK
jgi:hypothetical protein